MTNILESIQNFFKMPEAQENFEKYQISVTFLPHLPCFLGNNISFPFWPDFLGHDSAGRHRFHGESGRLETGFASGQSRLGGKAAKDQRRSHVLSWILAGLFGLDMDHWLPD